MPTIAMGPGIGLQGILLGMVLAVPCTAQEATASAPWPPDLEAALSMVGTLRLHLLCEISCDTHAPKQDIYRRWSIGETAVRPRTQFYALDGPRFRFVEYWREADQPASSTASEVVFDGAQLRQSRSEDVVIVDSAATMSEQGEAEHLLFSADYFEAVRVLLPCKPARLGGLAESAILQAIYARATVVREASDLGDWRVDEILPG